MSDAEDADRLQRLGDEELIRLAAGLDPKALEVLYDRHHVPAFSLAVRIVGSQDRAQDVVQAAFLGLWREAGRYDPTRGPVRTWLMSKVHNLGIDSVRQLSIHDRTLADIATHATAPAQSAVANQHPDLKDAVPAIRTALQTLPEDERRIIELAFFGGWTQDEIADMLKLSLDTVRSRARLGMIKIRDALLSELKAPP